MKLKKLSLRVRIFIAMILLIIMASVLIAAVAIYQYKEETQDYHKRRLERKEQSIKVHLGYVLNETTYERITEKVPLIFKDKIFEISNIHQLRINLYDLDGGLLITSEANIRPELAEKCLDAEILNTLSNTAEHRFVNQREEKGESFRSSYSYLLDNKSKNLAIINIPYLENDEFLAKELEEFLERLAYTYILMLLIAITLAYLLSKYITQSIQAIGERIKETRLEKRNEKINIGETSEEISSLVDSYNSMIDELEESAVQLARSEREQAWREMAKQVAHEIKNPLTPMRLSVQSFQRKFDPEDPEIHIKVDEYTKTLIQQIDTMSSIASAFSNFAKMPAQQNEMLNVVETTRLALDIFNEHYITFECSEKEIIAKFDRTQLIRVITNLVKNSIQAIPKEKTDPKIEVRVLSKDDNVNIIVSDNGIGITEDYKPKIFEPKFTTKTSGMGLGLAMVRTIVETYNGSINFTSEYGVGTTFIVTFPKV